MKYSDNNHIERDPTLIIYCKEWCEYLQKLVNLLRAKQQAFTFIDLRFDTKQAKALISELGNPLILPVLSFDGIYHEKPPISKVANILNRISLEETN
jgi:glutaredoxin